MAHSKKDSDVDDDDDLELSERGTLLSSFASSLANQQYLLQHQLHPPPHHHHSSTAASAIAASAAAATALLTSSSSSASASTSSATTVAHYGNLASNPGSADANGSGGGGGCSSSSSMNGGYSAEVKANLLGSARNVKAVAACSLYSFCSVSMILVNKSLASSYNIYLPQGTDLNILLVVVQAAVAVLCVEICKHLKWVERYPPLSWETVKSWAPVNLFFCWMLFTGIASLQYNSVPMVTVFKNITNIMTTAGDIYFFGSTTEALAFMAFGIMLAGAVAAARNDLYVTGTGLFWMFANCVCTSGYVLYMKYATQHIKLSKFGMVYVNNILCVFFLSPFALMLGQFNVFWSTPALHTVDYFSKNVFAGFVGFFLNFASLHCVSVTGPTTYAIVGSLNKIPVALFGYLLFEDVITTETWFYILINLSGGFLYSWAKIQTSRHTAANLREAK